MATAGEVVIVVTGSSTIDRLHLVYNRIADALKEAGVTLAQVTRMRVDGTSVVGYAVRDWCMWQDIPPMAPGLPRRSVPVECIPLHIPECDMTKEEMHAHNVELLEGATHVVCLWDGTSPMEKDLLETARKEEGRIWVKEYKV